MYKKLDYLSIKVYILILFLAVVPLSADTLGIQNWQTVLAGSVTAPLTSTSFGFTAMTDGGLLTAFSENGTILWQKPMNTMDTGFSSSFTGDFIFTANGSTLSLYNPSGNRLWTEKLETPVIEKPMPGFDGRVFVKEKTSISSYTLTGLRRFKTTVPEGNMNLMTLNDGSLLHIQKKEIDGKSTALRISPYGKIIEEIIFTGIIRCTAQSAEGIILGFTSGTIALCSVIEGSAETSWSFKIEDTSAVSVYDWNNTILVFLQDGRAARFLYGEKRPLWTTEPVFTGSILECTISRDSAVIKTESNLISMNEEGYIEKNIDISSYKNQITTITKGGLFVICNKDWTIQAHRIQILIPLPEQKRSYPREVLTESGIALYKNAQNILIRMDAGEDERQLINRSAFYMDKLVQYYFLSDKEQNTLSSTMNAVSITSDITTASLYGTSMFSKLWPYILEKEKDESIIRSVLQAVNRCAYDENGDIMTAIQSLLIKKKNYSESLLLSFCDTVVELCRFMGRPALMRRGKDILASFLGSGYSTTVQYYARKSMEKIVELEI